MHEYCTNGFVFAHQRPQKLLLEQTNDFHLHPHWEVAANPDGVETHHQGGNELDHLSEARMILPWTTMALMTAGMAVTVIG